MSSQINAVFCAVECKAGLNFNADTTRELADEINAIIALTAPKHEWEKDSLLHRASVAADAAVTSIYGWPWDPAAQRMYAACVDAITKVAQMYGANDKPTDKAEAQP